MIRDIRPTHIGIDFSNGKDATVVMLMKKDEGKFIVEQWETYTDPTITESQLKEIVYKLANKYKIPRENIMPKPPQVKPGN